MPNLKLPSQTAKIIMGLGNPGNQYVDTRHNIGKRYINFLVKQLNLSLQPTKFGHFTFYMKDRMAIVLFSSEAFMNESGRAAKFIFDITDKKKEADLVVVHDDLDNNLGVVKIKDGGSPEGHNGLKSIIQTFGKKDFQRVKLGIGRPETKDPEVVSNYVLGRFNNDEKELIEKTFLSCTEMLKSQKIL